MKEEVEVHINNVENEWFILIKENFHLITRRFYKGFIGADLTGKVLKSSPRQTAAAAKYSNYNHPAAVTLLSPLSELN